MLFFQNKQVGFNKNIMEEAAFDAGDICQKSRMERIVPEGWMHYYTIEYKGVEVFEYGVFEDTA